MDESNEHALTTFCPRFHRAVELIGRRWTGAILRAMMSGSTRFSDLARDVPGMSDRLLAERLRELEAEEIVVRTVIPEMPVRVEYRLTEKGASLRDVLASISKWADVWIEAPAEACEECSNGDDLSEVSEAHATR